MIKKGTTVQILTSLNNFSIVPMAGGIFPLRVGTSLFPYWGKGSPEGDVL